MGVEAAVGAGEIVGRAVGGAGVGVRVIVGTTTVTSPRMTASIVALGVGWGIGGGACCERPVQAPRTATTANPTASLGTSPPAGGLGSNGLGRSGWSRSGCWGWECRHTQDLLDPQLVFAG